ncbi:hypothetical protein M0805_003157 [Coniferiporia weirii]|nr:hypothetical protein M0805_003157 [Coniferiporia weirii]
MFRRKKSGSDAPLAQAGAGIISSPMPMAAAAPAQHAHVHGHAPPPLYERFTTRAEVAGAGRSSMAHSLQVQPTGGDTGHGARTSRGVSQSFVGEAKAVARTNGRSHTTHVYPDVSNVAPPVPQKSLPRGRDSMDERGREVRRSGGAWAGAGVHTPRTSTQPLSPPTSPTGLRGRAAGESTAKLRKRSSREGMNALGVDIRDADIRNGARRPSTPPPPPLPPKGPKSPKNPTILGPPSLLQPTSGPSSVTRGVPSKVESPSPVLRPETTVTATATTATPAGPDELGLGKGPSLGNSLEGRRMQRKPKYSPLAAFGPVSPTPEAPIRIPGFNSAVANARDATGFGPGSGSGFGSEPGLYAAFMGSTEGSTSRVDSASERPKKKPADPGMNEGSGSNPALGRSPSRELLSYQRPRTAPAEPSTGEPSFHSPPLLASVSNGNDDNGNDNDDGNSKTHDYENAFTIFSNGSSDQAEAAVMPSRNVLPDPGFEPSWEGVHSEAEGFKTRIVKPTDARSTHVSPASPISSPRPSQPVLRHAARNSVVVVHQNLPEGDYARGRRAMNGDSENIRSRRTREHGWEPENGGRPQSRVRTVSASSTGSAGRRVEEYEGRVHEWDALKDAGYAEAGETPRAHAHIPTPPTSVDGDGNDDARTTIGGSLDTNGNFAPVLSSSVSVSSSENTDSKSETDRANGDINSALSLPDDRTSATDIISRDLDGPVSPAARIANGASSTDRHRPVADTAESVLAPLSPPQSPPQSRAPVLMPQPQHQSGSRTKSKLRRPTTGDSARSYVPPSSASSSDYAPQSAPSALMTFAARPASPRKLMKSQHARPLSMTQALPENGAIEDDTPESGILVDADPFAKDEIVRAPPPAATLSPAEPETMQATPQPVPIHSQGPVTPPSHPRPDDYFSARIRRRGERLDKRPLEVEEALARVGKDVIVDTAEPEPEPEPETKEEEAEPEPESEPIPEAEPTFYPLDRHLMHPVLLGTLLPYLIFRDWCALTAVNDALRRAIEHRRELREVVLEHFLGTVGYLRWQASARESIMLTFRDLNSYMRAVSVPSHQYAFHARVWLDARQRQQVQDDAATQSHLKSATVQKSLLASSCRAYTRVVLRLRAQAEAAEGEAAGGEDPVYQFTPPQSSTSVNAKAYARSVKARSASRARTASRPPSPTSASAISHSAFSHHAERSSPQRGALHFRSPLFRVGHAPCLRVFVPSPEGAWLSDESVVECEKELKRAGVLPLLRVGDVIWDTAAGDEGNVGRMVWDGNFLIDLEYTYSRTGELPQYLHTLSFPPSYFHRVIRTSGNPICYIDISPWGEEIAVNLQLLQDRIKTETPQGGHHTVVRWIHRSRFSIRPGAYRHIPIAIPGTSLSVDPGWYGSVIVETEGTNEGLADLQDRCKTGFPPRAVTGAELTKSKPHSRAFRLLRERSRPGEIWLRVVREKERLL